MNKVLALVVVVFCAFSCLSAEAQESDAQQQQFVQSARFPVAKELSGFASNFINDQKAIWTSPLRINRGDVDWLAPIGAGAAVLFATDHVISDAARSEPGLRPPSNFVSNLGQYSPYAVPGGLLIFGFTSHNAHALEAGRLSTEAEMDTEVVVQVLKFVTNRQRPNLTNNQSFPSGHAASAFALASVMASEYHNKPFAVVSSYGFATAVSLARVGGLNHFPSDVLAGAVIGELIGRYVVHQHATVGPVD